MNTNVRILTRRCCRWGTVAVVLCSAALRLQADDAEGVTKITYEEHIKPIFREHCVVCHSADDKSSGLALDTYAATLEGGSGGASIAEGDPGSSRLLKMVTHEEQPYMPPDEDPIAEEKRELLRVWIEQGMPENSGSAIKKKKVNMAMLAEVSLERPSEAPMPKNVLRQPPVYTERASAISALAFSPWAPLLAVGGQEQVVLYHAETAEMLGVLPFPEGEPQSITFSRDGKLVLVGGGQHSKSGCAVLYSIESGERVVKVGDELDIVMAADINESNTRIALAGPQKVVRVFDTATTELVYEQKKHTDWIYDVRFSPDGVLLATSDRSNGLVVWEADTGRLYMDLVGHKSEIRSLAWRPDSTVLVSSSMDGTVKMWDMNHGNLIKSWDAHPGGVTAVAICNDGTIATTGADRKVKLWNAAGAAAGELPPMPEQSLEVSISVDGVYVAAGDWSGQTQLWKRDQPDQPRVVAANPETIEMRLSAAESLASQVRTEISVAESDLETKQKLVADITTQLESSVAEQTATQTAMDSASQLVSQMEVESKTATERMQKLQAELTQLQNAQNERDRLLVSERKKLEDAKTKKQSLDQTIAKLQSDSAPAQQAMKQAEAQLAAARTRWNAAQAKLVRAQQDREAFMAAKQKLQLAEQELTNELAKANEELTKLTQASQVAEKTLSEKGSVVQDLQSQLAAVQEKLKAQIAELKAIENASQQQQADLEVAKQELESVEADLAKVKEDQATFEAAYGEKDKLD